MLLARGLTLWRGDNCLFEDLDFALGEGQVLLVRGPNGAGKTTLLRVVCGLTRPEAGSVLWKDQPIADSDEYPLALAWHGHQPGLKSDLSIRQNLEFSAALRGQAAGAWQAALSELGLAALADMPVRQLSAGQQRRTALARLLSSPARLWVMDEPFTNLDAAGQAYLQGRLQGHLAAGGLALLAMHQSLEALPARELWLGAAD
ncbi:MAG: cytochrome c biogenesis heme-transporting ATPase CcmA [Gammaproteobacteria bacterium]|nr:MAG: cytochrome c biogenesis heme-transporting ATPase CcmA [Gammaproteobacteria bacterium]